MSAAVRHPDPDDFPPGTEKTLAYQLEELRLRLSDLGEVLWAERWMLLLGFVGLLAVAEMVVLTATLV